MAVVKKSVECDSEISGMCRSSATQWCKSRSVHCVVLRIDLIDNTLLDGISLP